MTLVACRPIAALSARARVVLLALAGAPVVEILFAALIGLVSYARGQQLPGLVAIFWALPFGIFFGFITGLVSMLGFLGIWLFTKRLTVKWLSAALPSLFVLVTVIAEFALLNPNWLGIGWFVASACSVLAAAAFFWAVFTAPYDSRPSS